MRLLSWTVVVVLALGGCSSNGAPVDHGPAPDLDVARVPDARADLAARPDAAAGCVDHPSWTVGLQRCSAQASAGYTLFAPMGWTETYLVDLQGRLVHSWGHGSRPAMSAQLLESGVLLRPSYQPGAFAGVGGAGGRIQELSWDGQLVWDYVYAGLSYVQHHDVAWLPSGNVVLIAWEKKTVAEAVAAGRDPSRLGAELWVDYLVEVRPDGPTGGTVVWEWHLWDHLIQDRDPNAANHGVVAQHPELMDINRDNNAKVDWTHANAVGYNETLDQLVLSLHGLDEVVVIDHGTTTAEAAGHSGGKQGRGGDLLYRWGNPANYGAGTAADQVFFGQHDAHWIAPGLSGAGDLLVFNNGGPRGYSTVDEIVPPVTAGGSYTLTPGEAFGPWAPTWRYQAATPEDLYSQNISSAQRLPNGNTLICDGDSGTLLEVTPQKDTVWRYVSPVTGKGPVAQGSVAQGKNNVFRARRYPPGFAGLVGKDLSPKGTVELP